MKIFPMFPDDFEALEAERLDHEQNPVQPDVDALLGLPDESEVEDAYQRSITANPDYEQQLLDDLRQQDANEARLYRMEQRIWNCPKSLSMPALTSATSIPPDHTPKVPAEKVREPAVEVIKESKTILPHSIAQELLRREDILVTGNTVYFFDGKIWKPFTKEDMLRKLTELCSDSLSQVGEISFIKKVYDCIFYDFKIFHEEIYPSQNHLIFLDGILDLRSGQFSQMHTPKVFATTYLRVYYTHGSQSSCPTFDRFIDRLAGGDPVLARRIWEAIGYLLTPDPRGKKFIVLQRPTNCGKSVLGRFIKNCFPREAVSALSLYDFGGEFSMSDLIGKALCLDMDLPAGALNDKSISHLKKLTGDDSISANIKFMPRATFVNMAKLLFASNHAILTESVDKAFEDRMVIIPISHSIPESEQDRELSDKLDAERDAAVVKAIQYYMELRNNGYKFSGDFSANCTTIDGDDLLDCIFRFASTACETAENAWTTTQEIYERFCSEFGETYPKNKFSELFLIAVTALFPDVKKVRSRIKGKGNPVYGYRGIKLKRHKSDGSTEKL